MKSLAPTEIASAKPRGNHQFSPAWIGIGESDPDAGVAGEIFLRDGLLDPMQVVRSKAGDAAFGLRRIERLVEVDHQGDVRPDDGAHALDYALVIGGITVAALDLDAAKALVE